MSQGFSSSGARIRRKVTGRTKAEVRDKLRELHLQVDSGLRPQRRYTVGDALDDWLAHGLDSVSARTVTLHNGTIAPALREQLGTVRLTDPTAGDVQAALTVMGARPVPGVPPKLDALEKALARAGDITYRKVISSWLR